MTTEDGIRPQRILLEGTAIVLSILLAFAIDAAWAQRQDRVEERDALEALHAEFVDNQVTIQSAIDEHLGYADAALQLLRISRGEVPVPDPPTALSPVVYRALVSVQTTNLSSGALEALLSSGNIDLIRDPALRRKLAAWPGLVEDGTEEEGLVVSLVITDWLPYLRRTVSLLSIIGASTTAGPDGAPFSEGLPDGPGVDYERLLGDEEFEGRLAQRFLLSRVIVRGLRLMEDAAAEIIGEIEAELD